MTPSADPGNRLLLCTGMMGCSEHHNDSKPRASAVRAMKPGSTLYAGSGMDTPIFIVWFPPCSWIDEEASGGAGRPDQDLAALEHVLARAEGQHIVTAIATLLEAPEHLGEIDGALTGLQVLLVVAAVVGHPHFAAARETDGIEKAPDALRDQVRMVDGEGPPERGRGNAAEVLAALLDAEREVVHLGMLRLAVQVLEEEAHAGPLGPLRRAREPRNARFPAGRVVRREVKPAVHDDPFGADPRSERDIGLEIAVDRLRDEGRRLRDIDARQRV